MAFAKYLASLSSPGVGVDYTCSCGLQRPMEELYFCITSGCKRFVCNQCSQQVIDTFFCPTCLNSFFSSTAFSNKSRCQQCMTCPACTCPLQTVNKGGKNSLWCENCNWSSEPLGLVAAEPTELFKKIAEKEADENGQAAEFASLFAKTAAAHRISRALPVKPEPVKTRVVPTHDLLQAVKKLEDGLDAKRASLWRLPKTAAKNDSAKPHDDSKFDVEKSTTLTQRLVHCGERGAADAATLFPKGQPLQIKLGHRCRKCNQHVLKPKAGATKVSFDIAHIAYAIVPHISLSKLPAGGLKKGKSEKLIVYFKNPMDHAVLLTLGDKPEEKEEKEQPNEGDDNDGEPGEGEAKVAPLENSATVEFPKKQVKLLPYDEVVDHNELLDDGASQLETEDDKSVVVYRHLSKVGIPMTVTPNAAGEVVFSLIVNLENTDPEAKTQQEVEESGSESDSNFKHFAFQATFRLGVAS